MKGSIVTQRLGSFGSFVGGRDVESGRWVYALTARALLDDSFTSLTLKRNLEAGRVAPEEAPPGLLVGRVSLTSAEVAAEALAAAANATKTWRTAPVTVRLRDWNELLAEAIRRHEDAILELLTMEGHPLELARWELSGMYELSRQETTAYLTEQLWREFHLDGRHNVIRRQADGVVCVNPPANAPLVSALLGATSICGGNAVVIRAPRAAPYGVTYALRNIIVPVLDELGAPPGVLNVVCGHPGPMIDAWLESPHVDDIMYFGDVPNGLKIERRCVELGKKPILELAGNDVVIVWRDADLERAADALCESFYGSGQLCMIPNTAVVHPDVADELTRLLVERAERLRPGYPDEEGVLLSPVLRHDKFNRYLADAVDKGAVVLTGGSGMSIDGTPDSAGFFLQPTVLRVDGLAGVRDLKAVEHETFFPLLPVVVPEQGEDETLLDELLEFANTNAYGLRNSLWARDKAVIERYVASISTGGLIKVNDSHIAFAAPLPSHGGTGLTGGVFGEANYPVLRTTHLQGISIVVEDGPRPSGKG